MSTAALPESRRTTTSTPSAVPDALDHPNTPPRTEERPLTLHEPVLKDTPAKARSVDHPSYRTGTIDEKRSAVLDDLGRSVPEIDLEFFLGNVLPPLRDGFKPTEIVDILKRDGHITNGYWKLFETEPMRQEVNEDFAFRPLADLFNTIVKAANERPHDYSQTLALRMDPNSTPYSEKDSSNRPDGYMILKEPEYSRLAWYDLGLTMEVKKGERSVLRDNNVGKQVFNMQHLMSVDPCRRSAFGITIENCDMRLWFCSRAVVLVSECFDFTTALETLVHIFLSFAFASKTELGWDPTISVTIENELRVYHFGVKKEVYDSVEVLSDFGADAVIGRATRVFKVKQKDGTFAVLKDVWIDDDRKPEHSIRSHILRDIKDKFGEAVRNRVAKYFLTPINAEFVKVDDRIDHTTKVLMRGATPSLDGAFDLVSVKPVFKETRCSTGYSQASDQIVYQVMRGARKRIHHRVHYRIVFREIGVPLHQVKKLSDVFLVLLDVSKVLKYIHECGWVHRDISAGNVYLYENKRGLLGDLEYAKRTGTDAGHEVRTGTLDFMAIEVAAQKYRFAPIELVDSNYLDGEFGKPHMDVVEEEGELSDAGEEFVDENDENDIGSASGASIKGKPNDEGDGPIEATENVEKPPECPRSAEKPENIEERHDNAAVDSGSRYSGPDVGETVPEIASGEPSGEENVSIHKKSFETVRVQNQGNAWNALPGRIHLAYNCLHDMESVWWAAIWMLFFYEDSSEKIQRAEADRARQAEMANGLFPRQLYSLERDYFFVSDFSISDEMRCLPLSFQKVIKHSFALRGILRTRYTQAEAKYPQIDVKAFEGIHIDFTRVFEAARDESQNVEIKRLPRSQEAPAQPKKRKARGLPSSTDARKRSRSLRSNNGN